MKNIQDVFEMTASAVTDNPDQQRILVGIRTVSEVSKFLLGVRPKHLGKGGDTETQPIDIEATKQYRQKLGADEITSNDSVWTETDYTSGFAWLIDEVDNTQEYRSEEGDA